MSNVVKLDFPKCSVFNCEGRVAQRISLFDEDGNEATQKNFCAEHAPPENHAPFLTADLEDSQSDPDWHAKAFELLAHRLGIGNDFYFPLIDTARKLRTPLPVSPAPAGEWQDISSAPKNEMFIWAAPKGKGKWSLGLAYCNVSGGWSDAYGSGAPEQATHWHPLPSPPAIKSGEP